MSTVANNGDSAQRSEPSMAELLEQSLPPRELRRGEVVEGQVMRIDPDGILVSIGHKSEGVVPQREMRGMTPEMMDRYQPGSSIPVYVIDTGSREGQALLSFDRARDLEAWRTLERYAESGEALQGRIVGQNRGGAVVDVGGLQAFVPLSQLVLPSRGDHDEALARRIGEEVSVKVLEVNRRRNRAVLSERASARETREAEKNRLLDELEEGSVRQGLVTSVSSFGAFVDIGGADGLIHISELSWAPVSSVEEVVRPGQMVNVSILRVDRENRRIALSLKRLEPTPWEQAIDRFQLGQLVTGTITKLAEFGAFALVEDTIEGLVHVSELTERRIRHPKEVVQVGDTITLRIITLDLARQRMGLSLRQVEEYQAI